MVAWFVRCALCWIEEECAMRPSDVLVFFIAEKSQVKSPLPFFQFGLWMYALGILKQPCARRKGLIFCAVKSAMSSAAPSTNSAAADSEISPQQQRPSEVFKWLGRFAPVFGLSGSQISILHEPSAYYDYLQEASRSFKRRAVLSALYLGTGLQEVDLVSSLQDRCDHVMWWRYFNLQSFVTLSDFRCGWSDPNDWLIDWLIGCLIDFVVLSDWLCFFSFILHSSTRYRLPSACMFYWIINAAHGE